MIKRIATSVAAVIVAIVIVTLGDFVVFKAFPPPDGIDFQDPAAVKALVAAMPLGANLLLLSFWTLAAIAAGALVGALGQTKFPGFIPGAVLATSIAINARNVGHPSWIAVIGVLLVLGGALLAGSVAANLRGKSS